MITHKHQRETFGRNNYGVLLFRSREVRYFKILGLLLRIRFLEKLSIAHKPVELLKLGKCLIREDSTTSRLYVCSELQARSNRGGRGGPDPPSFSFGGVGPPQNLRNPKKSLFRIQGYKH